MRKLTTKDFIDRASSVHGDKYGYAFSVYQSSKAKVLIHCPEHGMFEQEANSHIQGAGCPYCSLNSRTSNKDVFITKAIGVHGYKYEYNDVDYINDATKVIVNCKLHGVFLVSPNNHLQGKGCPRCSGKNKTTKIIIDEFNKIHCNKYNYSSVKYKGAKNKVKIQCKQHGYFEMTPDNHLNGHGCPGCANHGFDRTKVGFLYIFRSICGRYMKIGITNKPEQRHAQLTRVTPFSFKRIELIEGPGNQIANLEKELLSKYQQVGFTERFDGSTEWRLWDDSIRGYLV